MAFKLIWSPLARFYLKDIPDRLKVGFSADAQCQWLSARERGKRK